MRREALLLGKLLKGRWFSEGNGKGQGFNSLYAYTLPLVILRPWLIQVHTPGHTVPGAAQFYLPGGLLALCALTPKLRVWVFAASKTKSLLMTPQMYP